MKPLHLVCLLGLATTAGAQVNVTTGTYTQNFDSLASSGTRNPWINNETLPGWYAAYDGAPISLFDASSGFSASRLTSYGSVGSTDRALGTGFDLFRKPDNFFFGVRLLNATGTDFTSFSVAYTGEQWARNDYDSPRLDSLAFSYQIFDAGTGSLLAETGWTSVSALSFFSPNTVQGDFDGNAAGNFTDIFDYVTGIVLADGQELWLRWTATNILGYGDDLAIDNLTVTFGAIPEPASSAALLSLASLGLAGLRRRRCD